MGTRKMKMFTLLITIYRQFKPSPVPKISEEEQHARDDFDETMLKMSGGEVRMFHKKDK